MKYRQRTFYTEEQKTIMWDRWQQGDTLGSIARLFDRYHSSINEFWQRQGEYVLPNAIDHLAS